MASEFMRFSTIPEKDRAVLQVLYDSVEMGDWRAFVAGCQKLLGAEQSRLVIDMRGLRRTLSLFVGTIADTNVRAKASGRRLTVLASEELRDIFVMLFGAGHLEIFSDGRGPEDIDKPTRRSSRRLRPPKS